MTTSNFSRHPRGVPAGGRFAVPTFTEAKLFLDTPDTRLVNTTLRYSDEIKDLADAGLKGRVLDYQGDDVDVPDDAVIYESEDSHQLVLSGIGTEEFTVHYLAEGDDAAFRITHNEAVTAPEAVDSIEAAMWQVDIRGAFSKVFDGDEYEIRNTDLRRGGGGNTGASLILSDSENNWISLDHDYATGETSATPEGGPLEDPLDDRALDKVIKDLVGREGQAAAAEAFGKALAEASVYTGAGRYLGVHR
ncbi:hypothetical protein [Arthrobacter sp. zg-Y1110]|uniref:hypothetical protein n=1 Tax=Arthrobacter sp. zg-Y1110 TaxID=2886932 RepID=UPI001D135D1E|nr:hypothetical protein [Arthrobacter sp. zg-Y1110]MCC3292613.1 hypothetical protein [Arthrobacter sp. zg-Y1110]UWX86956.1 hypothetical protein N2K99_16520 [Arthrobacter sp. zg-Y1110]